MAPENIIIWIISGHPAHSAVCAVNKDSRALCHSTQRLLCCMMRVKVFLAVYIADDFNK